MPNQLYEWRNNERSFTLESLNPEEHSLWNMTRRVMIILTLSPLLLTREQLAVLAQFQPVNDRWVSAFIEVV